MNVWITMSVGVLLGILLVKLGVWRLAGKNAEKRTLKGAIVGLMLGLLVQLSVGRTYVHPEGVAAVNELNFDAMVLRANKPTVVDFYATWCGPCSVLAPRLEEVANTWKGKVQFVSVDIDRDPKLVERFFVMGVPTLVFFDAKGELKDRAMGPLSVKELNVRLEKLTKP